MKKFGKPGRIAVVENLGGELGDYCYRRCAMFLGHGFEPFKIFAKDGFPEDVRRWAAEEDVRAVVIDGSEKSPLDKDRWIRREGEFVEKCLEIRMPMLAICFGHELLAQAAGGQLRKGRKLRVELDEVKILKADPLFEGFNGKMFQPVSHSVRVSAAPPGFVHLAESFDCEFMAMRHVDYPCYGVQFHPEADAEIKDHDRVWKVMTDDEFERSDGPRVLSNFGGIVAAAG